MLADGCGAIWAPDEAQVDSRALGRALAASRLLQQL
jgi:glycine/D-amino acid oxidase-like deaminating enzyme